MLLIRETLLRARLSGEDTWDALAELGERIGVSDLRELGSLIKNVSDDGAQVRQTLSARAASMRRARLANEEGASPQVKARAGFHLAELKDWLEDEENKGLDPVYRRALIDQISKNKVKHLDHLPALPPGSPIGMDCMEFGSLPAVKYTSWFQQSQE